MYNMLKYSHTHAQGPLYSCLCCIRNQYCCNFVETTWIRRIFSASQTHSLSSPAAMKMERECLRSFKQEYYTLYIITFYNRIITKSLTLSWLKPGLRSSGKGSCLVCKRLLGYFLGQYLGIVSLPNS